jgi:hypothetical protein
VAPVDAKKSLYIRKANGIPSCNTSPEVNDAVEILCGMELGEEARTV